MRKLTAFLTVYLLDLLLSVKETRTAFLGQGKVPLGGNEQGGLFLVARAGGEHSAPTACGGLEI
jgi:hypothetical protein